MPHTDSELPVLVFAKAPTPGTVKTRLVPLLGPQGAAALHERLVSHTLQTAARARLGPVELHGAPAEDEFLRECAARHGATLVAQANGDLGTRMRVALERVLGDARRAMLVGSDCAVLTAAHLREAAEALRGGCDAVFVPTDDGGYALIGVTRCEPHLFRDISWSSSTVMRDTRVRLRELGWRWCELETLWDIDRPQDYTRLAATGLLDEIGRGAG